MKSNVNEVRDLLNKIRNFNSNNVHDISEVKNSDMSIRDMLKITRSLNEQENLVNKKTQTDQQNEENKFREYFDDLNVFCQFSELKIYDKLVFWGGVINGIIAFTYTVSNNENNSGVEIDYLEGFSEDDPDNEKITDRIKAYFEVFRKYWYENIK